MRIKITLLFLLGGWMVVTAQNPGFASKKHAVGVGIIVPNDGLIKNVYPMVGLERSLSFRSSFRMSVYRRSIESSFEEYTYVMRQLNQMYIPNYRYYDVFDDSPEGQIKASLLGVELALRRYLPVFGSIAPYGYYAEMGVGVNQIDISEGDAYLNGTYLNEPVRTKVLFNPDYARTFSNALNVGIGQKMYLAHSGFLEYQLTLSMHVDWSTNDGALSPTDIARYIVKRENAASTWLQLKMTYGLGF
ncbi:MAG: hypothetical protein H6608_11375 [Flavobacteriales bacterium]|nr:hypothetical protein [Bacteroidota bacterium]MCB9241728.1 hypothetical protein [Flavobacteriales bacterium]